jgi:hypothetical protein
MNGELARMQSGGLRQDRIKINKLATNKAIRLKTKTKTINKSKMYS